MSKKLGGQEEKTTGGNQIKVHLPDPLRDLVEAEKQQTGRPKAEIARAAMADRYVNMLDLPKSIKDALVRSSS